MRRTPAVNPERFSTYRPAPIRAANTLDAIDIAKRRAREDGWQPIAVETVKLDALGRWALVLLVRPIPRPD